MEKKKFEFSKIKEEYDASKERLRGCLAEQEIAAKPVQELEVLEHKMGKEYGAKRKATMDAEIKERTALTKLKGLGTTHDDKVGKLNSATRKEKDAEKNVARLKNEIRDYTQKMNEIPEVTDMNFDLLRNLKKKHEDVRKTHSVRCSNRSSECEVATCGREGEELRKSPTRFGQRSWQEIESFDASAQREDRYDDSR